MPSGVSDFGGGALLGVLFGISDPIAQFWVALCTDEPGTAMDGDILVELEPLDTSYARVAYPTGATQWAAADNYVTTLNDLSFPVPLVDWGMITHYALLDAPTGGNLIAWGEFLDPQYVAAGCLMLIPAGGLVVALDQLDDPLTL